MVDKNNSDNNERKLVADKAYTYCPWCATELVENIVDGKKRKHCPSCDFVHYKNPVPAAGAFIIEDDKVLLVKRKYPPREGYWSFPAGFMEYGESPANCCKREAKEETNLDVEVTSSFKVYSGADDPRTKAVLILYLTRVTSGKPVAGDDASELKYFPLDQLPDNIAFESHIRALREYKEYLKSGRMPDPNE
jgi:ADP-ribose pyrophosphatase YjhB (NUDIX family)